MSAKETNQTQKYIFGMADITWGESPLPIQGDAAVLNITPEFIDITSYELGGVVDKICKSWAITLEVVLEEETAEVFSMALPVSTDTNGNLTDAALGESLRAKAKELVIHPRSAGESKDFDIKIFKAAPSGTLERRYGLEQGKVAVTFTAMLKDGAAPGQPSNYFQIGDKKVAQ